MSNSIGSSNKFSNTAYALFFVGSIIFFLFCCCDLAASTTVHLQPIAVSNGTSCTSSGCVASVLTTVKLSPSLGVQYSGDLVYGSERRTIVLSFETPKQQGFVSRSAVLSSAGYVISSDCSCPLSLKDLERHNGLSCPPGKVSRPVLALGCPFTAAQHACLSFIQEEGEDFEVVEILVTNANTFELEATYDGITRADFYTTAVGDVTLGDVEILFSSSSVTPTRFVGVFPVGKPQNLKAFSGSFDDIIAQYNASYHDPLNKTVSLTCNKPTYVPPPHSIMTLYSELPIATHFSVANLSQSVASVPGFPSHMFSATGYTGSTYFFGFDLGKSRISYADVSNYNYGSQGGFAPILTCEGLKISVAVTGSHILKYVNDFPVDNPSFNGTWSFFGGQFYIKGRVKVSGMTMAALSPSINQEIELYTGCAPLLQTGAHLCVATSLVGSEIIGTLSSRAGVVHTSPVLLPPTFPYTSTSNFIKVDELVIPDNISPTMIQSFEYKFADSCSTATHSGGNLVSKLKSLNVLYQPTIPNTVDITIKGKFQFDLPDTESQPTFKSIHYDAISDQVKVTLVCSEDSSGVVVSSSSGATLPQNCPCSIKASTCTIPVVSELQGEVVFLAESGRFEDSEILNIKVNSSFFYTPVPENDPYIPDMVENRIYGPTAKKTASWFFFVVFILAVISAAFITISLLAGVVALVPGPAGVIVSAVLTVLEMVFVYPTWFLVLAIITLDPKYAWKRIWVVIDYKTSKIRKNLGTEPMILAKKKLPTMRT